VNQQHPWNIPPARRLPPKHHIDSRRDVGQIKSTLIALRFVIDKWRVTSWTATAFCSPHDTRGSELFNNPHRVIEADTRVGGEFFG
jgi:hypothetical protein